MNYLFEVATVVFMFAMSVYAVIMFNWVKRLERCAEKDLFENSRSTPKWELHQLKLDIEHAKRASDIAVGDIDALAEHLGVRFVNRSVVKVDK